MSSRALLLAVRDHLRSEIPLDPDKCDVRFQGKPAPAYGHDVFYGVYLISHRPGPTQISQEKGIDELYTIGIAITKRTGTIPVTKLTGEAFLKETEGLEPLTRAVIRKIHTDPYTILTAANTHIRNSQGFTEPLKWTDVTPEPEPVGPEWFTANPPDQKQPSMRNYGLVQRITFDGARRMQTFTDTE